jgi:DNA-binding Lrp family transcriptional regulator
MSDATHPDKPGCKAHGPSEEVAKAIAGVAVTLRDQVREVIVNCPSGITADEIAHKLNRSVLSVRPRVSELRRRGEIRQTGARGTNESGMSASVWVMEAATEKTREIEAELLRALEALA